MEKAVPPRAVPAAGPGPAPSRGHHRHYRGHPRTWCRRHLRGRLRGRGTRLGRSIADTDLGVVERRLRLRFGDVRGGPGALFGRSDGTGQPHHVGDVDPGQILEPEPAGPHRGARNRRLLWWVRWRGRTRRGYAGWPTHVTAPLVGATGHR